MYRERRSRVPGGFVWTSRATGDEKRVLPDGCMDLLWDGRTVTVAGADTHAQVFHSAPGRVMTGLRFPPGLAPKVLRTPAHMLTDQRVPLDALWPDALVRRVTERLAASATPGRVLEITALDHRPEPDEDDSLVDEVAMLAAAGWASADIARHVGISARQLQRRSAFAFGYGTKTLQRILRLQRALSLVREGTRAADSAALSGYADQAHLARDVKDLAGIPLTALAI